MVHIQVGSSALFLTIAPYGTIPGGLMRLAWLMRTMSRIVSYE